MLSESLEEIEQLSLPKVKIMNNKNLIETEIKPLCSFAQEKQIHMYIDQLENMFNSNEVINFIHNMNTRLKLKLVKREVLILLKYIFRYII